LAKDGFILRTATQADAVHLGGPQMISEVGMATSCSTEHSFNTSVSAAVSYVPLL
jgi:hypothetical protein